MPTRPFNAGEPLAYFITWTTYGTWLPGDERGWFRWGESDKKQPNAIIKEDAETKMKERPFWLSVRDRQIVEQTIAQHSELRNWKLHAVNARTNHVHVAVTASNYPPNTVRDQLKAWCTQRLKVSHSSRERFWTEGASCRYINDADDLQNVVLYVYEAQHRKHLDIRARSASE